MSNYNEIIKILKNTKINTPVFTVFDFNSAKKHNVDINNVISFYKMYCDGLYCKDMNTWQNSPVFTLGELAGDTMPVITEFIFRFESDSKNYADEKFYNKKLLHGIINSHQEVIGETIFVSARQTEYICAVLESETWQEQNITCVRLKFQFPFCRIGKKFLSTVFRQKLISKLRQGKLQKYFISSTPIGDWSEHLLNVNDTYCLYGSTTNNKKPPVLFSGVYGEYEDTSCRELAIQNIYNFRNHSFIANENCITEEIESLCEDDGENNYELSILLLPLFLSLHFSASVSRLREHSLDVKEHSSSIPSEKEDNDNNPSEMEIALELLDMLSDKRFNNENYFLDIGRALYYTCGGSEEGLRIWSGYAEEKSDNYDKAYCRLKYEHFDDSNITIKTLGWYARQDDEEKYKAWHDNWCLPKLKQCITSKFAHVLVAEAFYRVFWLDYMYTGKKWTEFRKSRLVLLHEDIPIRKAITDRFIPSFDRFRAQLSLEKLHLIGHISSSGENAEKSKTLETNINEIGKLISRLLSESYRGSLVKSIKDYFWQENLTKLLDVNPYLLGVKNCVIELTSSRAYTRPGKPEDYITKKVGVAYRSEYNYKHRDVQDLLLYFKQVFPESTLNEYMKKDVASMLYGRNAEKIFRMWIGETNGSKSVFQKMLRQMFGDYYCDLPPEFYSAQQKSGSGPNPELAQANGARVAFSAEPDDDTSFKGARIKKVTGGDSFFARGCNVDGGSTETTFKAIMVLNIVPDIAGLDEATRNRFAMIPFEGRWLKADEGEGSELPEDIEEQIKLKTYKMDDRFEDNLPRLASALLWLSVQYYKTYRSEGLNMPKYIKRWMNDYWKKHDPYVAFISEKLENPKIEKKCDRCQLLQDASKCTKCKGVGIIEEIDVTKSVTSSELYPEFKRWLKETHPHMQVVPRGKFVDMLSTKDKLNKQRDRRWWGVTLKKALVSSIENI